MSKLALILLFASAIGNLTAADTTCESLARLKLPTLTVTTAESVLTGTFAPPKGETLRNLPHFCRVAGVLKPSSDSHIKFEVWMPLSGWNRKFYGVGIGAFAGNVRVNHLAAAVTQGYAAAATDTGHSGSGMDGSWALGHPEKVVDFAYRAIHETTDKAKAIVRAFYGNGPRRSYFYGCSGGGRQALMEAQRFPNDYDGIIVGAPGWIPTRMTSLLLWTQVIQANPASQITPAKLPAIDAASLAACDADDGLVDGLVENPAKCRFDPSKLLCQGPETNACLTAPQVDTLKQILAGPKTSKGEQFQPGFSLGPISGTPVWVTNRTSGGDLVGASSYFFSHLVYEDASWNIKKFDLERDAKAADDKLAKMMNTTATDLGKFKARGGKLIMYQGWSDGAVPPQAAIDYYNGVVKTMGSKNADSFVRLFMAPGMAHCSGGPGPNSFGQDKAPQGDAQHDLAAALERWVDEGVAPDRVIAMKHDAAGRVQRTRPLCRYPQVARYKGSGSPDDARNFACVE